MPQQLIYTSAPRGIVSGRSGYCTVARSAGMREPLMLQLEKFCYYQHLSLSGGHDRPIFAFRNVDIRGTRFHVLSRIADAGLDFTGRTNFIAHHLVLTPEETRQYPTAPVILKNWPGWVQAWTKEPELLENEDWSGLAELNEKTNLPATTWQRVTGEAAIGYGLLDARPGATFRVDDMPDETVLELFAESLALLELREVRGDFRTAAWNHTFTTSLQEQDNPPDFRWRCFHADNPAAGRFVTPDCRDLTAVRAAKTPTAEEATFARAGRQAPRFVLQPQSFELKEGEIARFTTKTEGIPSPAYQWYSVDRAGNTTILPGQAKADMVVANPTMGKSSYLVTATNVMGTVQSEVAVLRVEQKVKITPKISVDTDGPMQGKQAPNIRPAEDTGRPRIKIVAEPEGVVAVKRKGGMLMPVLLVAVVLAAGAIWWLLPKRPELISQISLGTNVDLSVSVNLTASGSRPMTFLWYKDGQVLSSTTNPVFPLTRIDLTNGGSFYAVVTNRWGAATSAPVAWLGKPPVVLSILVLGTNVVDHSIDLLANVAGAGPLTYHWYQDGKPIASATNAGLKAMNTGYYYVIVTNGAGVVTSGSTQLDFGTRATYSIPHSKKPVETFGDPNLKDKPSRTPGQ